MSTDVVLVFESDEQREAVLGRLDVFLPVDDAEALEVGYTVLIRVREGAAVQRDDRGSWAIERARELVRGAIDGTGIDLPGMRPAGDWPDS